MDVSFQCCTVLYYTIYLFTLTDFYTVVYGNDYYINVNVSVKVQQKTVLNSRFIVCLL